MNINHATPLRCQPTERRKLQTTGFIALLLRGRYEFLTLCKEVCRYNGHRHMKRRSLLQSIISAPALAATTAQLPRERKAEVEQKGSPAGPDVVPPGPTETPTIPVVPADETSTGQNRAFSTEQMDALRALAEILMPPVKGMPGASQANSAEFLAFLIGCSPKHRFELYEDGLDMLNRQARERHGKPFAQLSAGEASPILEPLRSAWTYEAAETNGLGAFLMAAKRDVLRATVNSRTYIDAVSEFRRPRNASRFYWYPID